MPASHTITVPKLPPPVSRRSRYSVTSTVKAGSSSLTEIWRRWEIGGVSASSLLARRRDSAAYRIFFRRLTENDSWPKNCRPIVAQRVRRLSSAFSPANWGNAGLARPAKTAITATAATIRANATGTPLRRPARQALNRSPNKTITPFYRLPLIRPCASQRSVLPLAPIGRPPSLSPRRFASASNSADVLP